jgi:hypothetical protein
MKTLFDMLPEGPLVLSSRGDKTAIDLFLAGVRSWKAGLRARFEDENISVY